MYQETPCPTRLPVKVQLLKNQPKTYSLFIRVLELLGPRISRLPLGSSRFAGGGAILAPFEADGAYPFPVTGNGYDYIWK